MAKTIFNMADGILTPCNVARSWHWFRQVTAPCNVTRSSGIMTLSSPVGGTLQCHWIRQNVPHIGILHLVSISTISPQSTCHSAQVCEILSKSDHPRQKKMTSCRFSRWRSQPSWILGSNNAFFEKPNYITSYRPSIDTIALNCLVFEKIAFFAFRRQTDKQTNKQTNRWTAPMH